MKIQYSGLKLLDKGQQAKLKQLAEEYSEKFIRDKPEDYLKVIVKEHEKTGSKPNFCIHVFLEGVGTKVTGRANDYELNKAIHKAFQDIENQLD